MAKKKASQGARQTSTSKARATKSEAKVKVVSYKKLVALRQARDEARADVLQAEFQLNRLLNIRNLAGTDQEQAIADARAELVLAQETAAKATEMFEVEKFTAQRAKHSHNVGGAGLKKDGTPKVPSGHKQVG